MILGIVGAEAAKFTRVTEAAARAVIRDLLLTGKYAGTTSGHCHLGGVDIYCEEESAALKIPCKVFPPRFRSWPAYKHRNIQIATLADEVLCITVREFPPTFTGPRWPYCYHCHTSDHIKSGGCWTVKYAQDLGKKGWIITV